MMKQLARDGNDMYCPFPDSATHTPKKGTSKAYSTGKSPARKAKSPFSRPKMNNKDIMPVRSQKYNDSTTKGVNSKS